MMKLTKKKIAVLAVVAVITMVVLLKIVLGRGESTEAAVMTVPVAKKPIEESLTLKAPLEGVESVEILSRLHFEVVELYVQEGDRVEKGQLLAMLDTEVLQREIEETQNSYDLTVAEHNERLRSDQINYEQAARRLTQTEKEYEQAKALADIGGISPDELQQAANEWEEAQQAVNLYQVKEGRVVADVSSQKRIDIARSQLDRKRQDLEDARITSSINGTVTRVNVKVGRFADDTEDSKPMFVIENLERLQMKVLVSEYDIGKLAVGQNVLVSADILKGKTVRGIVSRISPTGEEKGPGSSERVIPTQIDIVENDENLISGITAKAKIEIAKKEDVLVLPLETLQEVEEGSYQVFLVREDQTLHAVPVTLGLETDLEAEISSDELQEGDAVVLAPQPGLTEGMKVTVTGGL